MYLFKRSPTLTLNADSFVGVDCTKKSRADLQSAVYMKNWRITDDGKLEKRCGYENVCNVTGCTPLYVGNIGGGNFFIYKKKKYLYAYNIDTTRLIAHDMGEDLGAGTFMFGGMLYIIGYEQFRVFDGVEFSEVEPYIPTVAITAPNTGGGVSYESVNLISQYAKILYSPDGVSAEFILPQSASGIHSVTDGGVEVSSDNYIFENMTKKLRLNYVPSGNVANSLQVTFIISSMYIPYPILHMRRFYLFGAENDSRVFAYGNDNKIYYSDVTSAGADPTYFPAENLIRVGDGSSCVTAMCRQYSSLAVFTERDAWYISPSSVDYDGYSKPTFPIFPLNGKVGCIDEGAVLINNCPMTVSGAGVYLWNSSSVRDERNAKLISQPIENFASSEFLSASTVFDHEREGEVWIHNGDKVAVYNYKRGVWYTYDDIASDKFFEHDGDVYFVNSAGLYKFCDEVYSDDGKAYSAVWESAFADFGTHEKKTVRRLFASFVPQVNSNAKIHVIPNVGKSATLGDDGCFAHGMFSFSHLDFFDLTFECEGRPRNVGKRLNIRGADSIRLRIENGEKDSRCTVDGIVIQVRLSI